MTKYNIYISTQMDTYNILGISQERLDKIVSSYKNGQSEFSLGGKKYWIKNLHEIQIFAHEKGIDPEAFMKEAIKSGDADHKFGGGYYISPKVLATLGKNLTDEIIGDSEFGEASVTQEATAQLETTIVAVAKNEVFIVHGHDDTAKTKTARFIEKLGFKSIILHEQASGSKTVIEKIEAYSNVGFGIVLYTPCDIGAKKEDNPKLKNRARQNVVFEHGFLIGKIGRENVCALVKDDIETPNDISGVVYVKMDEDDAWQLKIARELRNSGYDVDLNKL